MSSPLVEGIREFIKAGGRKKVILEASNLVNTSGAGKGGRVDFSPAYSALRFANPFRLGAMTMPTMPDTTAYTWVTQNQGNTLRNPAVNPWGYTPAFNGGTPNKDMVIWQLPVQVLSGTYPIRDAVIEDVGMLPENVDFDLTYELSTIEADSMARNNDQLAFSATNPLGTNAGLRGLKSYGDAAPFGASYGTSGTGSTAGLHTISTVNQLAAAVSYNDITSLTSILPPQFWQGATWHAHPTGINALRQLKDSNNLPIFLETGEDSNGAVGRMFGWNVIPNNYLDPYGTAGNYWLYLARWDRFLCIVDRGEIELMPFMETQPGVRTLWFQKRVVSSVYDPTSGVRLKGV